MEAEERSRKAEFELIDRAARGDRPAYDELMRTHLGRAYGLARRFALSSEDAADAVQDAFFAAYKALPRFNYSTRFMTWLSRILINRILNQLRRTSRLRRYFVRSGEASVSEREDFTASASDPHADTERSQFRSELQRALHKLPETHRTVFVLFEMEAFKVREIAAILDIPEGTVTSRLHHARRALRSALSDYLQK